LKTKEKAVILAKYHHSSTAMHISNLSFSAIPVTARKCSQFPKLSGKCPWVTKETATMS
jgi:hypothetical protein